MRTTGLQKGLTVLMAVVLTVLTLSGCASGPAASRTATGVFIEGDLASGEAETLNWILAADASSFAYIGNTVDSLAGYDNKYNIVLRCLAKDIEVSPEGLVYTITIRDDMKWSDKSAVTAEDYVYTLKNLMFSDWMNYNYKDDWVEEVDGKKVLVVPAVVNATTFTVTRQTVQPEFIYTLYDLIPYPKYISVKYEGDIEKFTQAKEFNELSYTGNLGPYRFKEWLKNDKFVLERNPDFFLGKDNGAPYFQQYVIKLFGTSAVEQAALEAGDITFCGIEPHNVAKFKKSDRINVYTVPTRGYNIVGYNLRNNGWEGLRKKEVRQALSMAVDKDTVCKKIYLGFAEPAFSFIPSSSPWYSDETLLKLGTGELSNKQKAMEMLKAAGYQYTKNGDKNVLLDKSGKQVKLLLVSTQGSDIVESMSLLIKQELGDIGINVEIKLVQWSTLLRQYLMNKEPGSNQELRYNNGRGAVSEEVWDLTLMAHNTDPMAPSGSSVFFASDGGLNSFGFFNDEVDSLFKRIKSKDGLDKEERRKLYVQLARLMSEQQPVDFLTFTRANVGVQKNVKGIEPGINMSYNSYLWRFE